MQTIDQRVIKIRLIHEMIQRLILEYLLRVPSRDLLCGRFQKFHVTEKNDLSKVSFKPKESQGKEGESSD